MVAAGFSGTDYSDPYDSGIPLLVGAGSDSIATPPSCWSRWRGRVISMVGAAGSTIIRGLGISPVANAISSLAAGAFTQLSIESFTSKASLPNTRRITSTVFGQTTIFGLTQYFYNTEDESTQMVCTSIIIACLGANALTMFKRLYEERRVRLESSCEDSGPKLQLSVPDTAADLARIAAVGLMAAAYGLQSDKVVRDITGFLGVYYGGEIAGSRLLNFLDRKIVEADQDDDDFQGTPYRTFKDQFTTMGTILSAALLVYPSIYTALPIGFLDGFINQALTHRLERLPVSTLSELRFHEPMRSVAFRAWEIAHPIIILLGTTSFFIWQEGFDLDNKEDQAALGTMFSTFAATFIGANLIDRFWNQEGRAVNNTPSCSVKLMDRLVKGFLLSPRVLGVHPAVIFAVLTNTIRMNDEAAVEGNRTLYYLLDQTAWAAYGVGMGQELFETWGRRKGTSYQKGYMALTNGALTFERVFGGKII